MSQRIKRLFRVQFKAEGLSLEKLAALCANEDIPLSHFKRLTPKTIVGQTTQKDYHKLCILAQERGWQITFGGTAGLSAWIEKVKDRWGLALGLGLAVVLIGLALQFVWQIDVMDAGAYEGDVRSYLEETGIGVGVYKGALDLDKLRQDLEWRYPKVAWVHTAFRGSTLVIRMVEGVPTPDIAPYGEPRDLVASRGGLVVSVEPVAGMALVKAGDIVKPGQVLIQGKERRGTEETIAVKARGRILARVWDQARVRMPLYEMLSEPTGERHMAQGILTPWFQWGDFEHPAYAASDTIVEQWPLGGAWWPISLRRETRQEVMLERKERPLEEVQQEASQAAMRLLSQKMGLNDDLVDKWVDCCMIEGGIVEACATVERVIDIAQSTPKLP